MNAFNVSNLEQVEISASPDLLKARHVAIMDARLDVQSVRDDRSLDQCVHHIKRLREAVREAEKAARDIKRPFNDKVSTIRLILEGFTKPLNDEILRLKELSEPYALRQRKEREAAAEKERERLRALQEEKRRLEAARKESTSESAKEFASDAARSAANEMRSIAKRKPEPKTRGVQVRRVLVARVKDPVTLWDARPDLCDPPRPRLTDIKAAIKQLKEGEEIPGVEYHYEEKAII